MPTWLVLLKAPSWLADGHLLPASSCGQPSIHTHPLCPCVSKFPLLIRDTGQIGVGPPTPRSGLVLT